MTFYGLGIALVIFALMLAWIAKVAERQGRMGVVWALVGAGAGIAGGVLGAVIVSIAIDADPSTGLMLLAMLAPIVLIVVAMAGVGAVVMKLPIATSSRRFTIHEMGRNTAAGTLVVDGDKLTIELPGGTDTVLLVSLRRAEADGECIRLAWDDGATLVERTYLMGGSPNTPDGRKQQSKVLAQRLVSRPTPVAQLRS
jgi:MFS family permease